MVHGPYLNSLLEWILQIQCWCDTYWILDRQYLQIDSCYQQHLKNTHFQFSLLVLGCIIFFLIFGGHKSFSWDHWYPCFGLLVTSALDFKARVDPFCVLSALCDPQIHLWCDTCWLYRGCTMFVTKSWIALFPREILDSPFPGLFHLKLISRNG